MRRWIVVVATLVASLVQVARVDAAESAPAYRPLGHWSNDDILIELPASVRSRIEGVSSFPLDRYGTHLDSNFFFLPQVRVGARAETLPQDWPVKLQFEYEHDLVTGTAVGAPRQEIGERLPNGEKTHDELRRLFLRATIPSAYLSFGGGYTMSHWGLGMLANDGAHGWTPGSALFGDPRSGDRVIRATIGTLPMTDLKLAFRAAFDEVVGDDVLLRGDDANQYIGSILLGQGLPQSAGLYIVYRTQDSNVRRGFDVVVYDLTASTTHDLDSLGRLTIGAEGAVISGSTSLGPTVDFPKHDLLQFAAVVRANLNQGNHGFAFDFAYASGDENFDDNDQNAFKIDPNYELGLLLFRQVMAAQTGRGAVTAADLTLVGRPVPDLERVPTGGSPSNTLTFFPRAWVRPAEGLEVYGGPLFAFSEVAYADPFNTRVGGGGDPRNAVGGSPGGFYGTELDLGTRYQGFISTAEFTVGLEGGVLFPGDAFHDIHGGTMGEVFGGRLMVDCRL